MKCECGNIREKHWLRCKECIYKSDRERYMALPYKEWDYKEFVCTWDGDKYFFDIEDLEEYMSEKEMTEIELLFCEGIPYRQIDLEDVCQDPHEDWEPDKELCDRIDVLNGYLKSLPPHSYKPGKVRTDYKIDLK